MISSRVVIPLLKPIRTGYCQRDELPPMSLFATRSTLIQLRSSIPLTLNSENKTSSGGGQNGAQEKKLVMQPSTSLLHHMTGSFEICLVPSVQNLITAWLQKGINQEFPTRWYSTDFHYSPLSRLWKILKVRCMHRNPRSRELIVDKSYSKRHCSERNKIVQHLQN